MPAVDVARAEHDRDLDARGRDALDLLGDRRHPSPSIP
jgi:hypothetical protein